MLSWILDRLRNHYRSDRARLKRPHCPCGRNHRGPKNPRW